MKILSFFGIAFLLFITSNAQTIQLHPGNPHYFEYEGRPTVLVASTEHYGAVINADFDYKLYLETIHKIGLNHTRLFLGDYVETDGAFCIENNPLAPAPEQFTTPWARSNVPGYKLGGNKFDLDTWNTDYFERLESFMEIAEEKGIVVEVVLFFAGYLLENSPFHTDNNINGTNPITIDKYMTLENGNILDRQKSYCLKLVETLNRFDNLIINIANEPWFDNQEHLGFRSPPPTATKEWILKVSEWIVAAEKKLPKKHLISVDYCNEGEVIPLDEANGYFQHISVFNHHYDRDAKSVTLNYDRIPRVFSFNETGLMDPFAPEYRTQGWKYFMCGGALYNNLDFTFQTGHEDGTGTTNFTCMPFGYYGCTDPGTKYELALLLKFWNSIDFVNMEPNSENLLLNYGNFETYLLSTKDLKTHVLYFIGQGIPVATINVFPGTWKVTCYNTKNLQEVDNQTLTTESNSLKVAGPFSEEDMLVKIEYQP